jgi:hypothetical protein
MVREIPLSQGLVALVDDEDYETVSTHKWQVDKTRGGMPYYARRSFRRDDGSRTSTSIHRFLTGWDRVDHVNGNGLDCRRSNMRPATNAENQRNRHQQANNSSGYIGVAWDRTRQKWMAYVGHEGKFRSAGRFSDPEAAAIARDRLACELHGEFARLNFPPNQET